MFISRKSSESLRGTKVSCRQGEVRIESPAVFGGTGDAWHRFVDRMSDLPDVQSLEINRRKGSVRVVFEPHSAGGSSPLERLAAALSSGAVGPAVSAMAGLEAHLAGRRKIRLFRRGATFSTWEIVHELPGRLRVRDVGLRGRSDLVRQIELELHTLPGVHTAAASATTGSLLIRFDPDVIDRDGVLASLDDTVRTSDLVAAARNVPARASFTLANTTLALATVGEFLFPAVLPASALLLVATNLPAIRGAVRDLRRGSTGLPLLQTSIVVGTLATGGFIASSMMSWLLLFWQNRHARRVATARQILGASVRKQHRTAWVCRDSVEVETPTSRLNPGDVISVREGDMLPADGRIVVGTAMVDETVVRGSTGLVCRTVGQSILRGSILLEGELRVEITHCGETTVAERIGQALDAATQQTSLSLKQTAPPIAKRAVPPALLTAGVGLMVGDATTAVAILRPDYATAPSISGAMLLVHQLGTCLQAGMIVRQARVFAGVAAADMVLVDDGPALNRREIEVAAVAAIASFSEDDLLRFAECALRGVCDPRAEALARECAARRVAPLESPRNFGGGQVELRDGTRRIRVGSILESPLTGPTDDERPPARNLIPPPLDVWCDGKPVGQLSFREGDRPAAAAALYRLRTEHGLQIGLLSRRADAAERARLLGLDFHRVCETDADKAACIAGARRGGHRVAYIGDCRANPVSAAAADVAIAPVRDPGDENDPADVWLLQADYGRLTELWEVARSSRRQEQMHHGMTLIPNLTCVAGAFLFGFTSLAAVVISNLGTYSVYRRSVASLTQTERRLLGRYVPPRRRRIIDAAQETSSGQCELILSHDSRRR